MTTTPDIAEETLYCTVHPDREATLRCNKCGRPMCVQCAVQTPVGYRCKECVRGIQSKYFNANPYDDLIALGVAGVVTGVAGYLISAINLPIFITIIAGFPVGGFIGELVVRAVQRRRSRNMAKFAVAGAVIGGVLGAVLQVYARYSSLWAAAAAEAGVPLSELPPLDLGEVFQVALSDIGLILAVGIIAVALYSRLRMRG
ncbi:B-box zinc finger protein [Candidatus Flexifilum breve]|uniref:B-box zinc finger protein n=1 Tax=Candidatus Flexifilum breve TaxID=3140694 RepID=UPI0031CC86C1